MSVGDLVKYTESGKEYNALVLGERVLSYTYRDAENNVQTGQHQTIDLVFARERTDAYNVPIRQHVEANAQVRLDVVHESHAYNEDEQKHFGKSSYDGGRWKEAN